MLPLHTKHRIATTTILAMLPVTRFLVPGILTITSPPTLVGYLGRNVNWHQNLHALNTLISSICGLSREILQKNILVKAQKFPICLEESSTDSLEIISCLMLAWMSPLHDLAGWSLFLVLQDH